MQAPLQKRSRHNILGANSNAVFKFRTDRIHFISKPRAK